MKERGEIKDNKRGKSKRERNGGAIGDTSLDLRQSDDQTRQSKRQSLSTQ